MGDLALLLLDEVESSAIEPIWLTQLRQEVAELRSEVTILRRDNLELRQQAGYWRSQHAAAKQRIAELEQGLAQLRGENRKLQDQLLGPKSERASSRDRSNRRDGEEQEPAEPPDAVSEPIGPGPSGATTVTCRSSRSFTNGPSPSVAVPAVGRRSRPATPRIPSRSRSRSAPTAG